MDLAIYALLISAKEVIGEMYLRDFHSRLTSSRFCPCVAGS